MRIIAGKARSMPLKTPPGTDTRPTTDRIRETLFNMLQEEIPGSVFLDLFSGSGGVGLEAASRGAQKVVLVESSRKAASCIRDNIRFTRLDDLCDLRCMDAVAAVKALEKEYIFDLIFMDPPYCRGLEKEVLRALLDSSILRRDTVIIVEMSAKEDPCYLSSEGYEIVRIKKYKTNQHIFLRRLK